MQDKSQQNRQSRILSRSVSQFQPFLTTSAVFLKFPSRTNILRKRNSVADRYKICCDSELDEVPFNLVIEVVPLKGQRYLNCNQESGSMSKPFTYWVRLATVATLCTLTTFNPALAGGASKGFSNETTASQRPASRYPHANRLVWLCQAANQS